MHRKETSSTSNFDNEKLGSGQINTNDRYDNETRPRKSSRTNKYENKASEKSGGQRDSSEQKQPSYSTIEAQEGSKKEIKNLETRLMNLQVQRDGVIALILLPNAQIILVKYGV